MQSFIMNPHEVFIHIHQGCFAGTGAIVRLPQCQWSKPDGYGEISQGITTTKHSKAKTVCIFLGIYCILYVNECNVISYGDLIFFCIITFWILHFTTKIKLLHTWRSSNVIIVCINKLWDLFEEQQNFNSPWKLFHHVLYFTPERPAMKHLYS